jgi:hypothetical protein
VSDGIDHDAVKLVSGDAYSIVNKTRLAFNLGKGASGSFDQCSFNAR